MLLNKAGIRRDIGGEWKTGFFQNIRGFEILKIVRMRELQRSLLIF